MVDSDGIRHLVATALLFLKFPIFRGLDPGTVKEVYLAEVSSDVVELLIDLAQGLDRYLKLGNTPLLCQPILSAGSMWLVSQSSGSSSNG